MLNVTDAAGDHLSRLLTDAPDGTAVRFVPQGSSLIPKIDEPQAEDETFDHDGRTVLILDQQIATLLNEKTLDVRETQQGAQLALV